MGRIAGRPSPLYTVSMLIVALLVASNSSGSPGDDPAPKSKAKASTAKKAGASKSKTKDKDSEGSKPDDSKPKTPDEKKAEEKAKQKDAALKVAEAYIVLLDKGKYGESWDSMTAHVRKGITRRKWIDSLGKTRGTYGVLQGRKLKKMDLRATDVAEKFDEAWVYTEFQSVDGQSSSELLVLVLEKGKDWAVNSYWIGDPANFPKQPVLDEDEAKTAKK
jgi:Protein of unknown function (DUF4019)